jgi:lysophospholipid acyltransferase (LPLAT)-like uncharacterized protein
MMPLLWHYARTRNQGRLPPVHILVSHHRDGRFIGRIVRWFHMGVLLGSSSRGGGSALRQMVGLLARGDLVSITPDGPRGPRRRAAEGVAQLAAVSRVPVLPCAAQSSRVWRLRSWDQMTIPKPFGRGVVVCLAPIRVERTAVEEGLRAIEVALTEAADKADRLCPP